jgi:hypothetical protein
MNATTNKPAWSSDELDIYTIMLQQEARKQQLRRDTAYSQCFIFIV